MIKHFKIDFKSIFLIEDVVQKVVDELKIIDQRMKFIAIYLIKSLNIKTEKWNKLYLQDENKMIIDEFLDDRNLTRIVFFLNASQNLVVNKEFPTQIKNKVAYFIKKSKTPVKASLTFPSQVVYGDLGESPFDQIYSILDGVEFLFLKTFNYCPNNQISINLNYAVTFL